MKHWIQAARLRTLPLALACLGMGGALAAMDGHWNPWIFWLSLGTAFSLQILSNLANDYGDAKSGVDGADRLGPSRTVQTGQISSSAMKKALYLVAAIAFALGLGLLFYAFKEQWAWLLGFLGVGLLAIWASVRYTVGDNPYGYAGWGDLFVLIFFGWVAVFGSYLLYHQHWCWDIALPSTGIGLLAVGVLNVNNIRDIESDRRNGKISIPVRLGRDGAVVYHIFLLVSAGALYLVFGWLRQFTGPDWLFLLAFPLLVYHGYAIVTRPSDRLDPMLKQLALTTLLLVALYAIGQFI